MKVYQLKFDRMEGNDIILKKVPGAGSTSGVVRLENIDDPELIKKISSPLNIVTTDNTSINVNN